MRTMRFAWCLVWGCVALAVQMAGATVSVDLAGVWSVRLADGEQPAVPLNVPGDVHSALLAAGRIPDPYFGANEMDIQWVGQKAWLAERGHLGNKEDAATLEQVRGFFTSHQHSRFADWFDASHRPANMVGYRKAESSGVSFFILPPGWAEITKGRDPKRAAQLCLEAAIC